MILLLPVPSPTFLRGQNVVVDAAVMAEREMRRAKATELQKVLLQQVSFPDDHRKFRAQHNLLSTFLG